MQLRSCNTTTYRALALTCSASCKVWTHTDIFGVLLCGVFTNLQGFSPHGAEVEGDDGASEEGEGFEGAESLA